MIPTGEPLMETPGRCKVRLSAIICLPEDEAKLPVTQGAGGIWVGPPGYPIDDPEDLDHLRRNGFVGLWRVVAL